ncbi:carboxymuconolactone decarboxylase family protein [Microbacterium terregens]
MSTTLSVPVRLDIDALCPGFSRAMVRLDAAATGELDSAEIEGPLRQLVRIRASQLNGCAYCVDLHTKDALEEGESFGRLAAVSVWRESPFFTQRERSALSLTESITRAADTHVADEEWSTAATDFLPTELGALVALIVTINAWNSIGVTTRAWTPVLVGSVLPVETNPVETAGVAEPEPC